MKLKNEIYFNAKFVVHDQDLLKDLSKQKKEYEGLLAMTEDRIRAVKKELESLNEQGIALTKELEFLEKEYSLEIGPAQGNLL